MCWYVVVLDGEIAHLGVEPHATRTLAERSAEQVLVRRQGEGLGFPHALLELPEPLTVTDDARWYVLEIVERIAFISSDGAFGTEVGARETAVRRYRAWALLRVFGLLSASPPVLRRRARGRRSGPRSYQVSVSGRPRA